MADPLNDNRVIADLRAENQQLREVVDRAGVIPVQDVSYSPEEWGEILAAADKIAGRPLCDHSPNEACDQATKRSYTLYVCSLCGSDDVTANEDDAFCNECQEWMNTVPVELIPAQDSPAPPSSTNH